MRILMITHAIRKDIGKEKTSAYLLEDYFKEQGNEVIHVYKDDWSKLLKIYRNFKPDVIFSIGVICAPICFLKKIGIIKCPIIFNWNDYYVEIMSKRYGKWLIGFLENYSVKNSDGIISPSKTRYDIAKKMGKDVAYITNGIKKDLLELPKKNVSLKGIYDTNIVYTGAQVATKRVDKLVEAMGNIKANLFLIGNINEEIKRTAPKNVYFLGYMPQKESFLYVKTADFVILPDDNEAATKLFEYFAFAQRILAPVGRTSKAFPKMNIHFYKNFEDIDNLIKNKKKCKRLVRFWDNTIKEYIEYMKKIVMKNKKAFK